VVSFVVFIGIMVWAWSKRRSDDFAEAANLPFEQD
jgi:cytochrome c oxidase cbb3-type subunit 4